MSNDPDGKMKAGHKIYNSSEKGIAKNKAAHAKSDPKSNAKSNAKVQEAARVENEERIAKMSKKEAIISKAINKPLSELLGGK